MLRYTHRATPLPLQRQPEDRRQRFHVPAGGGGRQLGVAGGPEGVGGVLPHMDRVWVEAQRLQVAARRLVPAPEVGVPGRGERQE